MEMANTPEMVDIALRVKPNMVTLVPERRQEVTTEGGLDVVRHADALRHSTERLQQAGIEVSLFIDPVRAQVEASKAVGATFIEFHTGRYCEVFAEGKDTAAELKALTDCAVYCGELGLSVNAGHGLNCENVGPIVHLPGLVELNIGHSIISDAIFIGLGPAVRRMKDLLVLP
jgi:pyridoxine 5-phosphate synthase